MEIIIIMFGISIFFMLLRIYKKISEIGTELDVELQGLNQKMVTLLVLKGDESNKNK